MNLDARRLSIGRFLLVVYLLILSASVFHVHEHGGKDIVCQDCVSHVRHGGHITEGSVSLGDCVLCSFLSTSYVAAEVMALAAMAIVLHRDFVEQTVCVVCRAKSTMLTDTCLHASEPLRRHRHSSP